MNAYRITVKSSTFLKTATLLQLPLSVIVVAFGPLHMYRVSYFIGFSLFLHVLCYLM
ncbi:hypothetical protein GDO86_017183 [Hymenochirus boettgeri]|uniref:GPI inositol-deacylase transmembrane domain-containing protein n=1 Tax=Hymenochirus boettgeri TaxID=247094 RepID=A0A8T2IQT9_9PIPI|nr:hypothetical protein GDO86_017183 [Hymenochirus boettgeri]